MKSEFGIFGLGVMGKSLSRNFANNGFKLSLFNRHFEGVEEGVAKKFVEAHSEFKNSLPFDDIEKFVNSLEQPRKILIMVNAGKAIDSVINTLVPYLSEGDILIDGGNSNFELTKERFDKLQTNSIEFIGCGISGGEEGALKGPSMMPSGNKITYNRVSKYLEAISAKDNLGNPCCTYIGPEGSGHFVKMVHNGIEYVEMQLIAELYSILLAKGFENDKITEIFEAWLPEARSYLLEITIDILRKKDGEGFLIDKILDKAGNKGTGNWATLTSAKNGIPSTQIATALYARYISFFKEERVQLSLKYSTEIKSELDVENTELLNAFQFARVVNHHQGFKLIAEIGKQNEWNLNLSEIARIWTNGCIIRSDLMQELISILKESASILNHPKIVKDISEKYYNSAKKVVSSCILNETPISCFSDAVNYFNAIKTANSSANLIQAQRDYFGAHTYQRIDDSSEAFHHTHWND
jgi:6-phosphogluconate dehydrogenase